MTSEEIRSMVLSLLGGIAPEADLDTVKPNVNLRDQLDLDSVDLLNFVIALHKEFHVEIPEKDYPRLFTIQGCVDYISSKANL